LGRIEKALVDPVECLVDLPFAPEASLRRQSRRNQSEAAIRPESDQPLILDIFVALLRSNGGTWTFLGISR
jgi:hypothetical protein